MCKRHIVFVTSPAPQYFSTLSHKWHDFRKQKVIEYKMCILIFSTTFVWNIPHSKKNWERYGHKCILVFKKSTGYSRQILTKLEFPRKIFEKQVNTKFHDDLTSGSRVVPCGRTDRPTDRTDITKLKVAFRNFANTLNTYNFPLVHKSMKFGCLLYTT